MESSIEFANELKDAISKENEEKEIIEKNYNKIILNIIIFFIFSLIIFFLFDNFLLLIFASLPIFWNLYLLDKNIKEFRVKKATLIILEVTYDAVISDCYNLEEKVILPKFLQ